jgi:hypothetical protein
MSALWSLVSEVVNVFVDDKDLSSHYYGLTREGAGCEKLVMINFSPANRESYPARLWPVIPLKLTFLYRGERVKREVTLDMSNFPHDHLCRWFEHHKNAIMCEAENAARLKAEKVEQEERLAKFVQEYDNG